MTSNQYVTGFEIKQVVTRHMSGASTARLRVPHAIGPALTVDDLPARAKCGATVQQLSTLPFPPGQHMDSMMPPCPFCEAIEIVD